MPCPTLTTFSRDFEKEAESFKTLALLGAVSMARRLYCWRRIEKVPTAETRMIIVFLRLLKVYGEPFVSFVVGWPDKLTSGVT